MRFFIDQANVPEHVPRYNVAPGQLIPAIVHDGTKNRLGELKWGLVPNWAQDAKGGFKMINARAETVREKPAFRASFQRKRCIIPADGFYEWKETKDRRKQPMRIVLRDRSLFAMAGLYDTWMAPDGSKLSTCTIITTAPNALMRDIHDRMPVILRREDEALWLDRRESNEDRLLALLQPYPADEMEAYPVSPKVGSVKNDDPDCAEPWGGE
ncbi:putative SOS response-associated peptidase YoqW [Xylanibacillus composti]|uniref:Abasic site processing protein n=2 Tax=Xylanibacillus composti TaxID=1572762 RepID=A0A8J4H434_9BACL|nr:putative SOS response-associated peptidase YoqW [Xylanibacillus composti]